MRLLSTLRALALSGVVLGTVACNDDDTGTGPTAAQVAGTYHATTLTASTGSFTRDVLQSGGSLTLRLIERGILTGHITIPSEGIDSDLIGTWRLEGNTVSIDDVPGADTFLEDLELVVHGNTLVADEVVEGIRIQAVMTKQ